MSNEQLAAQRCNRCDVVKAISEFHRDRSKASGFRSRCKQCENAERRGAPEKARERRREAWRRWAAAHQWKARENIYAWEREKQAELLDQAVNHRKQWTGPELDLAARADLPARQVARMLGRSYYSVRNIRRRPVDAS